MSHIDRDLQHALDLSWLTHIFVSSIGQASPEGQIIFDKLLKACNEVSLDGQSILVLNHIRVDPPYHPENCTLVDRSGGLDEHSLERVKKIVGVATAHGK